MATAKDSKRSYKIKQIGFSIKDKFVKLKRLK